MKDNKGFTLIELLAVIVILAIVMVIATPKIIDLIGSSRESTSESSLRLVKSAIETQVMSEKIYSNISFDEEANDENCYLFDFDSDTNGNVSKLNLKNKDTVSGSITYCDDGTGFKNDTLGNNSDNQNQEVVVSNKVDLLQYVLNNENITTSNLTLTLYDDYFNISSSFGNNGNITVSKSFTDSQYTKIYVRGYRYTSDSTYSHFYLSGFKDKDLFLNHPSANQEFEYTYMIDEATSVVNPYIEYCVGSIDILEWYIE